MIFYSVMVNAWSLLYDELYGDDEMTEDTKITSLESDEYDPKPKSDSEDTDWNDPVITSADLNDTINIDVPNFESFTYGNDSTYIGLGTEAYPSTAYMVDTTNYGEVSIDTSNFDTVQLNMPDTPTPGIQKDCTRKYKEDESIKALQDYISTTYGGHYTSKENNVQTLDLIESVGDAESFCRSNAIKYLSRYDKKGQAKRDILKALHYTLLLYHFSGQLNETPTRGYETF
jgi:hypothetical protein